MCLWLSSVKSTHPSSKTYVASCMEPALFPGGPGAAFVLGPHSATSPASAPGPLVPGHLDVKSDTAHSDPIGVVPPNPCHPCSVRLWGQWDGN